MLIPPNVLLYDALQPLRRDLRMLENGLNVQCWDGTKAKQIRVAGAISCLIGDHPQACDTSRHLGNMAKKNCRFCHVDILERMIWDEELLDHTMTRRRLQSDSIVQQLKEEHKLPTLSATAKKALSTKYGIRNEPCPYQGLHVDTHLQAFPDVDHLIDLGLLKSLLNFMVSELSGSDKEEL